MKLYWFTIYIHKKIAQTELHYHAGKWVREILKFNYKLFTSYDTLAGKKSNGLYVYMINIALLVDNVELTQLIQCLLF